MALEPALRAEALDLQPVGRLPPGRLESLAARLSRRVELPVHILAPAEMPLAKIPGRDQLDAGILLGRLESLATADARVLVGVTSDDIAIPVFTFVFGLARQGGAACLVSLARTDPLFYGLPADPETREGRAVCEVLHELGHLATLEHCPHGNCLMSFAGSIEKVDARGARFCERCAARLPRWLSGHAPGDGDRP